MKTQLQFIIIIIIIIIIVIIIISILMVDHENFVTPITLTQKVRIAPSPIIFPSLQGQQCFTLRSE